MNKNYSQQLEDNLYQAILCLKTKDDCKAFFSDLCTNKEVEQMAQRIEAARLLQQGKTYNQVMDMLDISSATLARVSRALQYGEGYKKIL